MKGYFLKNLCRAGCRKWNAAKTPPSLEKFRIYRTVIFEKQKHKFQKQNVPTTKKLSEITNSWFKKVDKRKISTVKLMFRALANDVHLSLTHGLSLTARFWDTALPYCLFYDTLLLSCSMPLDFTHLSKIQLWNELPKSLLELTSCHLMCNQLHQQFD